MKYILLFTAVFAFQLFINQTKAQTGSYFPNDCWGVYSWSNWDTKTVSRESHPLIKGTPIVLKWKDVEVQSGKYLFDELIGEKLKLAVKNEFYTFLMVHVAPKAPRWLYENGVPELQMTPSVNPLGEPRDWTFQYYLDEDYIFYYHRLLRELGKYIQSLPPDLHKLILYVQSAEGSTGDGWPYKGTPLEAGYDITDEAWGEFRINAWQVLKEALSNEKGELTTPILVNYDSNTEKQYDWLLNSLPVIGLKNGMFSHGYHISETKQRLKNWEQFKGDVYAREKELFSRGEQDGEWAVYGWSTQNPEQAFYWSAIFATHCRLDMWNVPAEVSQGYRFQDAINFFNRYAGQQHAATATHAFCALRKGLDASDTLSYPTERYGEPVKSNIDRYLKISESFKSHGAKQGDPEKAIGDGMVNRKRKDYNDVGWGILDGNYCRYITQIEPESTSTGWWHKGPRESIYSRFARSINNENKNKAIFFDVDDRFSNHTQGYELRIVWLDEGKAKWSLQYDALDSSKKEAFSVQNANSGEWKEKTVQLNDARFRNKSEKASDILIRTDGFSDAVFHLIELSKK